MKTLVVEFESGKKYHYTGKLMEILTYKIRIKENEERRERLGMNIDKAIKFELTEYID